MLLFKHRSTNQEKYLDESSPQAEVYINSPSWELITKQKDKELQKEENIRVNTGRYNGLKKQQLRDLLDERKIKFYSRDTIKDLIKRLEQNDEVNKKDIELKSNIITFTDNLI